MIRLERFLEAASLALDQLRANRFRSALTILGIVVGVATVMAISAVIQGIRHTVMSEMDAVGPKNFIVARYDVNEVRLVADGPPGQNNPFLTIAEARHIEQLPAVRKTIVGLDLNADFVYEGTRLASVTVAGREDGWTEFTSATMTAGHDMLPADVRASAPVVLLSRPLAATLFGPLDPIGRPVRIRGIRFRVIGVFQMSDNIFASIQPHLAIMPYTTAIKHLNAWTGSLVVFTVPTAAATQAEAMDQVIAALRTRRGLRPADANDFSVIRQDELLETFNTVTGVFFLVLIALSSVALMVGGVGVIAIMMIAVTERTREIGIRKAIGATRREILWQFLLEAVTVTVLGAAVGMLLGGGSAYLVAALTPIPASVPFSAIVSALLMAACAGILFGMLPAWRAARLDPVEALRHE